MHHDLRRIDGFVRALVCGDLESARDRFDARKDMGDRWFQPHPAGGNQANGVFQMGLGADVREEVTEAAFAEEIDIELQRPAEPGDADDLAAGTYQVKGLHEGLVAGESLFRAAAGAFEDHVCAYSGRFDTPRRGHQP